MNQRRTERDAHSDGGVQSVHKNSRLNIILANYSCQIQMKLRLLILFNINDTIKWDYFHDYAVDAGYHVP